MLMPILSLLVDSTAKFSSLLPSLQGPGRAILASAAFADPALASTTQAMQAALVAAVQEPGFVAAASNINGVDNFFLSNRTDRLTAFTPGIDNFLDDGALAAYQGKCPASKVLS